MLGFLKYFSDESEKEYRIDFILDTKIRGGISEAEIYLVLTDICRKYRGIIEVYHKQGRFRKVKIVITCMNRDIEIAKRILLNRLGRYVV